MVIEADGQIAGELEVLALVVAHRNLVGVIEEDVGGLEDGVGEQPGPHRLRVPALLLELGHPSELPDGGDAFEQPGQPGMLGHMTLDEEGTDVGIEADGQQSGCCHQGAVGQHCGVVVLGQGVEVDDAVEGLVVVLVVDPGTERSQVVAEMDLTARLHA